MSARVVLARELGAASDWGTIRLAFSPRLVARGHVTVRLSPSEFRCAAMLITRVVQGQPAHTHDLIDMLFGDRADGGPISATGAIRRHLHALRRRLARIGVVIDNMHGRGWVARVGDAPVSLAPPRQRPRLLPRFRIAMRRAA